VSRSFVGMTDASREFGRGSRHIIGGAIVARRSGTRLVLGDEHGFSDEICRPISTTARGQVKKSVTWAASAHDGNNASCQRGRPCGPVASSPFRFRRSRSRRRDHGAAALLDSPQAGISGRSMKRTDDGAPEAGPPACRRGARVGDPRNRSVTVVIASTCCCRARLWRTCQTITGGVPRNGTGRNTACGKRGGTCSRSTWP